MGPSIPRGSLLPFYLPFLSFTDKGEVFGPSFPSKLTERISSEKHVLTKISFLSMSTGQDSKVRVPFEGVPRPIVSVRHEEMRRKPVVGPVTVEGFLLSPFVRLVSFTGYDHQSVQTP